jgi:hypothetical protein
MQSCTSVFITLQILVNSVQQCRASAHSNYEVLYSRIMNKKKHVKVNFFARENLEDDTEYCL